MVSCDSLANKYIYDSLPIGKALTCVQFYKKLNSELNVFTALFVKVIKLERSLKGYLY